MRGSNEIETLYGPYCDLRVVEVVVEVRLRDEHVHLPTLNDWVPRASCPRVVDLCLALPLVTL